MENGYKIGDRVRFLDFEGDGRVSALPGGDILEIEMDGMRMRVSSREVVRIDACDNSQEIRLYDGNNRISQFKQKPIPHNKGIRTGRKSHLQDGRMEVDLHMERIRENILLPAISLTAMHFSYSSTFSRKVWPKPSARE